MATQEKIQNARRTYRTLNDENAQYKKLIFELRKRVKRYKLSQAHQICVKGSKSWSHNQEQ
ncbi:hypothetical protein GQS40_08940|uniref:Uncharacterized protein n=1 Tax=Leuconostoc lactis TaxID=1246 RepID=A0A6L7A751_LEULA|nr:hypothetical protein [Leuconostoc lactis]